MLRYIIMEEIPDALEKLSMGIPTYYRSGKLFSFAGQKGHFYFYPGVTAINRFYDDVEQYLIGRNTLCFSYDKPVPEELVKMIVHFRLNENINNQKAE
jgi:uncharacterized protein YdhG (YjbR/CyaY superfamily)